MGWHIRDSLCKCSPSITKDIKYNDKNDLLIYIMISVQTNYFGEINNIVIILNCPFIHYNCEI
jgi:hypothetical protein